MQQLYRDFLIGMRERAKFQVLTGLLLEDATTVLTLVSLWMVELLNLIMRQQASPVPAIALARAFQMGVGDDGEVTTSVALPVVETTGSVLVVAGVRQLARRCFEGLQVEPEELVLLQVGQLIGMRPEAIVRALAVALAGRGLVDEGMEAVLIGIMRVLAGLRKG
jgi:hypothetical protein